MARTQKYFCAFCRTPRFHYGKRHLSLLDLSLALFAALLVMFSLWQSVDPRVVVIFVAFVICGEIFVLFRYRLSLRCPHCGFDPLLYKRDRKSAASAVSAKLAKRKQDPLQVFKRPLDLPKVKRSSSMTNK